MRQIAHIQNRGIHFTQLEKINFIIPHAEAQREENAELRKKSSHGAHGGPLRTTEGKRNRRRSSRGGRGGAEGREGGMEEEFSWGVRRNAAVNSEYGILSDKLVRRNRRKMDIRGYLINRHPPRAQRAPRELFGFPFSSVSSVRSVRSVRNLREESSALHSEFRIQNSEFNTPVPRRPNLQ